RQHRDVQLRRTAAAPANRRGSRGIHRLLAQRHEGDSRQRSVLALRDAPKWKQRARPPDEGSEGLRKRLDALVLGARALAERGRALQIAPRERPHHGRRAARIVASGIAPGLHARVGSPSTTNSAMSFACMASPRPVSLMPSLIMVRQNGQLVAMVPLPPSVAAASSTRFWLMRWPSFSSSHIRPPPAPQQNVSLRLRSISLILIPSETSACRGASLIPLWRGRAQVAGGGVALPPFHRA